MFPRQLENITKYYLFFVRSVQSKFNIIALNRKDQFDCFARYHMLCLCVC